MILKSHQILILLITSKLTSAAFMRRKYMVDVENGFICSDNDQLEIPMRKYRVDRLNRTHRAFTMDFSFARPIDQTVEGTVIMERWTDSGWVGLPLFPAQPDPCRKIMNSRLKTPIQIFVTFGRALGLAYPEECNIPAGNYSVNRYPFDITSETPFFGGRFRATMVMRRIATKQKVFCAGSLLNFAEFTNS